MIRKDFINHLMKKYNIDDNDKNYNKISGKIDRIIKKNSTLKEFYSKLDKVRIGKGNNIVLNETITSLLENEIKSYLLKINKIDQKDYNESKNLLKLKNKNKELFDTIIDHEINQPNIKRKQWIDKNEKLNIFIEALFYDKFEFDEMSYIIDSEKFKEFQNSETPITEEVTQIIAKLKNPVKYYVKTKKIKKG